MHAGVLDGSLNLPPTLPSCPTTRSGTFFGLFEKDSSTVFFEVQTQVK